MTMWKALATTYRGSIAFLIACPMLVLVPVAFELLQHGAEVRIGMYDSIAAAKGNEHHPLRMSFGFAKVLALILPGFWVTRFLALGRPALADAHAWRLFAGVFAFHAALAAVQLFALPQTAGVTIAAFAIGHVVACLTPAWAVAAALGNPAIGPGASIRLMARHLPWTFVFLLLALIPPMIPHYALGAAALLAPKAWLWPILAADSFLVGWLSAVMVASTYWAARHAADAAGFTLAPADAPFPR